MGEERKRKNKEKEEEEGLRKVEREKRRRRQILELKENKENTERESITGGKKNENGEKFRKKTDIKENRRIKIIQKYKVVGKDEKKVEV